MVENAFKALNVELFKLLNDEQGELYKTLNLDDKILGTFADPINGLMSKWALLTKGQVNNYNEQIHLGLIALHEFIKQHNPSIALPEFESILQTYNAHGKEFQAKKNLEAIRKPDFKQRLPGKIKNVESEMVLDESKRQASLVTPQSYFKIRQLQMQYLNFVPKQKALHLKQVPSQFIGSNHPLFKKLNLKYPIFFGEKGEVIALMQATPNDTRFQLGRGASGTVFLGMDIDTGKQVAVKVLNPSNPHSPQTMIDTEKQNLSEVDRLIATAQDNQRNTYIVDEYAWGETFHSTVDKMSALSTSNDLLQAEMAIAFLKEMQRLHDAGFLHRDMRLDNMMWDPVFKKAKIIDFGLAVKYDQNGEFKSKEGVGNPFYVAPETEMGHFSIKSDTFAAGISTALILIGTTDLSLIKSSDRQAKLKAISPEIMNMLSEDPAKRPQIKDVIRAIQHHKNKIEKDLFKNALSKATPGSIYITADQLENNRIKKKLYGTFLEKKTKVINKFNKDSLYVLLQAAVKDQNSDAFVAIAKVYGLGDKKHQEYTAEIVKSIKNTKNEPFIAACLKLTSPSTRPAALVQSSLAPPAALEASEKKMAPEALEPPRTPPKIK